MSFTGLFHAAHLARILAKDLDGTENKTNLGANAILGAVEFFLKQKRPGDFWYC